jgi:hypothetical protein
LITVVNFQAAGVRSSRGVAEGLAVGHEASRAAWVGACRISPESSVSTQNLIGRRNDAAAVLKVDGSGGHRKYAFRYTLRGRNGRHIAIATRGTEAGTTVYINRVSRNLEALPIPDVESLIPGVSVGKVYARGSRGASGDKGLSSAAASCETLDPRYREVVRMSVSNEAAFLASSEVEFFAGQATPFAGGWV